MGDKAAGEVGADEAGEAVGAEAAGTEAEEVLNVHGGDGAFVFRTDKHSTPKVMTTSSTTTDTSTRYVLSSTER